MNVRFLIKIAVVAALAACLAGDARADVKVVSTVNVTGQFMRPNPNADPNTPPPFPQTITVYYKGPDARVESSNGEVKIFKGVEGKVYSMLPAKKIYFVRTYAEEAAPMFGGRARGGAGGGFKPDVSVTIATDSTATAKTLGGVNATRNTVSGTFTMPSFGGGRGGRSGRGGFGGGGNGGGNGGGAPGGAPGGGGADANPPAAAVSQQGAAPMARLTTGGGQAYVQYAQDNTPAPATPPATPPTTPPARVIKLDGEVWTSAGVALPDDPKATALPSLVSLGQGFTMFLTPLSDSITKNKMVPLDIKVSYTRPSRNPDVTPTPVVGTITTKSVSTGALDASLFTVPADYTQVDPPAPMFGGGRGGRGGGGPGGNGGAGNGAPGGNGGGAGAAAPPTN